MNANKPTRRRASGWGTEFVADDPDGSVFWYNIVSSPTHGLLNQDGGRRSKFSYSLEYGFIGVDTVTFYSIDDDSLSGPVGKYVFDVSKNCRLGFRGNVDYELGDAIDISDLVYPADLQFTGCNGTVSDDAVL